jgi:hypothetical protein
MLTVVLIVGWNEVVELTQLLFLNRCPCDITDR